MISGCSTIYTRHNYKKHFQARFGCQKSGCTKPPELLKTEFLNRNVPQEVQELFHSGHIVFCVWHALDLKGAIPPGRSAPHTQNEAKLTELRE